MATIARKIMYAHMAEDGKTPVFNAAQNKFEFVRNPTNVQLSTTEQRLQTIDSNSAVAVTKADTAKTVADSKVTADEAVSEVKDKMFYIVNKDGDQLEPDKLTFTQTDSGFTMEVCVKSLNPFPVAGGTQAGACLRIGYPTMAEFNELKARVAALENNGN